VALVNITTESTQFQLSTVTHFFLFLLYSDSISRAARPWGILEDMIYCLYSCSRNQYGGAEISAFALVTLFSAADDKKEIIRGRPC